MIWHEVAKVDEIKPGEPKLVTIAGKQIGVMRDGEDGPVHAVLNFCPHAGAPICHGRIKGAVVSDAQHRVGYDSQRRVLRCPWHHWEFDLNTGGAVAAIRERIMVYPVRVEGDRVMVKV
jgi:nitrite reductase (NADH) small subunit